MKMLFTRIGNFFLALIVTILASFGNNLSYKYRTPDPDIEYKSKESEAVYIDNADFYISPYGNDNNDGSKAHPFLTFEKAKLAVRDIDKSNRQKIIVAAMAGDYRINTLEFSNQDSGNSECEIIYCAYGDGEVNLNGGITIPGTKFRPIEDDSVKNRLNKKVQNKILCCNLNNEGITKDDYGKIYAIGTYNTAFKYSGDTMGPLYCELFVNDNRMTLARYPNKGFLYTEKVIKTGEGKESNGSLTENKNWDNIIDPESDVYEISDSLAKRINSWKTLDDVWMFGFWKYDWADASSPVGNFDFESRTISPKYVSMYGTKVNAPYYFYNVFEELDEPGEWYLDRNSGIIYLYPENNLDSASIDLTLTKSQIIKGNDINYITFDGLTIKGTRGDAVNLKGNNITIKNSTVKNVAGSAIVLTGYNNIVSSCEVTRTGRGGIYVDGGDIKTLTPGKNEVNNNLIHDWSEIYQTYQPAITLSGVGNSCAHNEIYNSPHEAITYSGNNHLIEYNLIHDVCLLSDDAAAIYSGRHWDWYGTVIRYNCIYNLGSEGHRPTGIYFDDALSGQTAYGNLLINIPDNGFLIGGGRDITVKNNIIVNAGKSAFYYDQRAIDGVYNGWFTHASTIDAPMWQNLINSPWKSTVWQEAYPQMKNFSLNFDDPDSSEFLPNPSYSDVSGNIVVDLRSSIGTIAPKADKYSSIKDNAIYSMLKLNKIFNNPDAGDYTLKEKGLAFKDIPDFEPIPIDKIGRISN